MLVSCFLPCMIPWEASLQGSGSHLYFLINPVPFCIPYGVCVLDGIRDVTMYIHRSHTTCINHLEPHTLPHQSTAPFADEEILGRHVIELTGTHSDARLQLLLPLLKGTPIPICRRVRHRPGPEPWQEVCWSVFVDRGSPLLL